MSNIEFESLKEEVLDLWKNHDVVFPSKMNGRKKKRLVFLVNEFVKANGFVPDRMISNTQQFDINIKSNKLDVVSKFNFSNRIFNTIKELS